jgi:hypothetical protein
MMDVTEDFADTWKVLIYDQDCRDIISPLMNIGALRQLGVTLHMLVRLSPLLLFYAYLMVLFLATVRIHFHSFIYFLVAHGSRGYPRCPCCLLRQADRSQHQTNRR